MTRRELDAAGIHDPALRAAYSRCRTLNADHGRTYFLATHLLSPAQRPAVHALYGFARWVDDIVDGPDGAGNVPDGVATTKAGELDRLESALQLSLRAGYSDSPILAALTDTVRRYGIEHSHLADFMASMRADLTVTSYPTRQTLDTYMRGSAEVIGLQVLPILGTVTELDAAAPHAAALGRAFQLTNFVRDIAEDLDRGRVYLPADELAAFGVDRERLQWCYRTGGPDLRVRRALADQVARARAVYRAAQPGIAMLDPVSRPCVATAYTLYGEILDRVVEADYNVFSVRAAVSAPRRFSVVANTVAGATVARTRARWSRPDKPAPFLHEVGW